MKYLALIVLLALIFLTGCRIDYDLEEVAPPEHLGEIHDHEHVHEHDSTSISGSNRHVHEAGARNHGTGWFFNQPWAARFIWSKMIRDTVILVLLAAVILLASRYRLRKKH
ncbi:MAG: hypothetical protein K8R76_09880 [Candidatus Aegiribacteria sp.]|nr:hypothetical protein [Candidatus Aegiribacteria sp.]